MLNEQLKAKISDEAIEATKDRKDTDFDIGWNQGYEKGYEAAAEKYAELWQGSEASAKSRGEIITQLNNRLTNMETALEWIKTYGPDQSKEGQAFIDKALAWKGKEVSGE